MNSRAPLSFITPFDHTYALVGEHAKTEAHARDTLLTIDPAAHTRELALKSVIRPCLVFEHRLGRRGTRGRL